MASSTKMSDELAPCWPHALPSAAETTLPVVTRLRQRRWNQQSSVENNQIIKSRRKRTRHKVKAEINGVEALRNNEATNFVRIIKRRNGGMERSMRGILVQLSSSLAYITLLLLVVHLVSCKPNNNQQQQQSHDRQLLKKALEERDLTTSASSGNNRGSGSGNSNENTSATQQHQQPFQCPEQFGYYTDARDCTKYYVCVFGEVLHESCTGGLRFSRELQTCDWPRNVDCPNQANSTSPALSSSTAAANEVTTTPPQSTTSPLQSSTQGSMMPTSSTPVSVVSTSTTQQSTTTSSKLHQEHSGNDLKASLVFADEANDPQQPSFDEAVSPVITADGAIHVHDGSGGTFGLGANPQTNRALQTGSPARQSMQVGAGSRGRSLDVFVKPLNVNSSGAGVRPRVANNQQQQQQPSTRPKLQAATLPVRSAQQQRANNFARPTGDAGASASELSDEAGDFSGDSGSETSNGQDQEQPANEAPGSQADQEAREAGDSAAAAALQDSPHGSDSAAANNEFSNGAEGLNEGVSEGSEEDGDSPLPQQPAQDQRQPTSYIPPMLATGSQFPSSNGNNNQRQSRPQQVRHQHHHSSPLLSINNRQITDSSRQSFKPILINNNNQQLARQPQPQPQQQFSALSQQTRNLNQRQNLNNSMNFNQNGQFVMHQNDNINSGNNRQSRMSSNFQQQSNQFFPQANNGNLNQTIRFSPSSFQHPQSPMTRNNNNNNFNSFNISNSDTSKPIRFQLPANSQQLTVDNLNGGGFAALAPPASNNFPQQSRFPASASSQSSARSQQQQQQQQFNNNGAQLFTINNFDSGSIVPLDQQLGASDGPISSTGFTQPQTTTSTSFASLPQLLQQQQAQQRRPRPPKRHQIPGNSVAGGQSTPARGMSLADLETTTTPIPATTSGQFEVEPTTTALRNEQQFDPAPNVQQQQQQFARTVVAPTTVNFQQQLQGQQDPSSTAYNSAPAADSPQLVATNGGQQQRGGRQRQQVNGSQRVSFAPTSPSTTSTTAAPVPVPANNLEQPGGQANRFLQPSGATDALEAGQPFGTVDYDFDVLNGGAVGDNSTDRRQQSALDQQVPSSQAQRPPKQQQQRGRNDAGGGTAGTPPQAVATTASSAQRQNLDSLPPTKKPRPTNKKIVVDHEKALANNRASSEPARRPENLFSTPTPLQTAAKCDSRQCRLPDCKCGDTLVPGGLEPKTIPQTVLLTFDDAVNDLNWEIYEELFSGRTNPNGCPILATFYVSHEWTDYGQVQTLYSRGHEMASHSVTHSFGEKFSKSQWFKEINGQREILNMYGGVKMQDVRGMRAPFLQIGGNKMFEMLYDANFTYDSSMPIFENSPPLWPYTLDYQVSHECMITPCPTKSYPGVWEVGMTMWVDLRGGRCSMGDACSNPPDEDGVFEMLMKNFNRHYKSNRAPFGLFYHSAWFNTVHHRRGFLRFLSTVNALSDVFFVTNWQMLQWMRQPTPLSEINSFEPWQCPAKNDRPPPCYHPSVCNVKSEHGTRFMKTCQPCPANQQYPWVGATGFKGATSSTTAKQTGGSG